MGGCIGQLDQKGPEEGGGKSKLTEQKGGRSEVGLLLLLPQSVQRPSQGASFTLKVRDIN